MKKFGRMICFFILAVCGVDAVVMAEGLESIPNYREYSPTYASSGQPSADQLQALKDQNFERIIYLAFSDQHTSLAEEDRIVKDLGMEYVHIPVLFDAPGSEDFAIFAAIMAQAPDKKTLTHCQVNFRAATFSLLYRVIYQDVPIEDAKEDMNSVWAPNETWRNFIFDVLRENGKSAICDVCDWGTE